MLIHPPEDEVLETLWYYRERAKALHSPDDMKMSLEPAERRATIDRLVHDGHVTLLPTLSLLPSGEERARGIVRRHRLAEVLFNEVMGSDLAEAEESACEFEHALTERVVDRVCTFMGHPPKCPHGKPIPRGKCCSIFELKVEPLIARLIDVPIGTTAPIVFIAPKTAARLNRLATLGVVPGTNVKLLQRKPSVVIQCGETALAIEADVAGEIYVRA
ncbi:MAG: metal-dependent transcriptional regulator [Thermoanaerobaculia bacterium]|jgi:DtxR family Mn-dependent transcriptional regulator